MKALQLCVTAVLVIGLSTVVAAGGHDDALMKEAEAIGDALAKALLDDDVEMMLTMYVDDAISLPNYGPRVDGVDAFRKQHEEMAAAGMKILSFDSHPTDVWECGNQVIEIGTFTIALEAPPMPGTITDKGKYMTVYVRDADGALKIKAETWNTDTNPMEMGAGEHGP